MKNKNTAKTESNFKKNLKGFSVYLFCMAIALLILYYFDGAAGMLLCFSLGIAFLISLIITLLTIKFVETECTLTAPSVAKSETVLLTVTFKKRIPLPSPAIEIHTECSVHLTTDADVYQLYLGIQKFHSAQISFMAKYSGLAHITVKDVFISDYLGIFRFRLKNSNSRIRLCVYPNIPDVPVQTNFLKTAVLFSQNRSDDEEETNETALHQTGFPGHDHREYYPGDPIKRINWKLSSKKDVYMVRLDEKTAESGQLFFLHSPPTEENDVTLSVRDNIIESMLAVFSMIINEGHEIVFFFVRQQQWHRMEIRNGKDIEILQELLSDFQPSVSKDIVPSELRRTEKIPICFTAATDKETNSALQIVSEIPDVLMISSYLSGLPKMTSEFWCVNEDFDMRKL